MRDDQRSGQATTACRRPSWMTVSTTVAQGELMEVVYSLRHLHAKAEKFSIIIAILWYIEERWIKSLITSHVKQKDCPVISDRSYHSLTPLSVRPTSDLRDAAQENVSLLMEAMSQDAIEELVATAFAQADLDRDDRCVLFSVGYLSVCCLFMSVHTVCKANGYILPGRLTKSGRMCIHIILVLNKKTHSANRLILCLLVSYSQVILWGVQDLGHVGPDNDCMVWLARKRLLIWATHGCWNDMSDLFFSFYLCFDFKCLR